jgi:cephalosporin hydroxylase
MEESEQPALQQGSTSASRTPSRNFRRPFFWRAGQLWGDNTWAGVKALKGPWDIWIAQEILWETRPDLVVETGVHESGSPATCGAPDPLQAS